MKIKNKIIGGIALAIATVCVLNVSLNSRSEKLSSIILSNNIEALAVGDNNSDDWTCKKLEKDDPCMFQITTQAQISWLLKKFPSLAGLTINYSVNLKDFTALYSKGGNYRCGNDVRCADAKPKSD
jgi:hypothetical protein